MAALLAAALFGTPPLAFGQAAPEQAPCPEWAEREAPDGECVGRPCEMDLDCGAVGVCASVRRCGHDETDEETGVTTFVPTGPCAEDGTCEAEGDVCRELRRCAAAPPPPTPIEPPPGSRPPETGLVGARWEYFPDAGWQMTGMGHPPDEGVVAPEAAAESGESGGGGSSWALLAAAALLAVGILGGLVLSRRRRGS
jgi:hypothetical protein